MSHLRLDCVRYQRCFVILPVHMAMSRIVTNGAYVAPGVCKDLRGIYPWLVLWGELVMAWRHPAYMSRGTVCYLRGSIYPV